MAFVAALVKYNPCTIYARRGVACSSFLFARNRKCFNRPEICSDPANYDGWLKDVVEGKTKSFFPKRISLLEVPGSILVLHHSEKRAIIGEATITHATYEKGIREYWFERFTFYPNPVRLRLIKTDPRISQLSRRGRWRLVYLSSTTLSEIRDLSELQGESKIRLEREIEELKRESERRSLHLPVDRTPIFDLETSYLRNKGFEPEILAKANELFLEFEKKEVIGGRSHKIIFYAALYLAYRLLNKPKRLEDIAETGQLDSRRLWHSVRTVETILEMKLPPSNPRDWIIDFSHNLNISEEMKITALNIADELQTFKGFKSKNPISIAATAIYLSMLRYGETISKSKVANVTRVSGVTIRNIAKLYLYYKKNRGEILKEVH